MKNLLIVTVLLITVFSLTSKVNAQVQSRIDKANKAGKVVFLVVTDGNNDITKATSLAEKASKSYSKSTVLTMNINDKTNAGLVSKYRLMGAPMPLLLVVASNGFVAGGAPANNLSSEVLVSMIPTPKEEVVIKAINEGNSVFVVFTKKSDSKNKKQLGVCQSACKSMNDKAITINVDIDDKKEKSFIAKFRIDNKATYPVTMVINAQGQVASMFNGITEAKGLVSAARKKVSSGCCPPKSGKTCGPAKK
ncbi:hypothetical protein ACFLSQ_09410 [Bacteroidota bacterium]